VGGQALLLLAQEFALGRLQLAPGPQQAVGGGRQPGAAATGGAGGGLEQRRAGQVAGGLEQQPGALVAEARGARSAVD
jgi:hypothetical protein